MTPGPISTAPQEDDQPLLPFYPDQGGWHPGVRFRSKWLAYIDTGVVLEPSHWLPVPPIRRTQSDRSLPSRPRTADLRIGLHRHDLRTETLRVRPR